MSATEPEPFRPKLYTVMPHYGDCHPAAVEAHLNPSAGATIPLVTGRSCGSATPHCFNKLLAAALDARDHGFPLPDGTRDHPTHLAMIHSDVEVPAGWADTLYREMARVGADAIAAVVPIKEPERSRTSTAIGAEGNVWHPLRYIRAAQRPDLPLTFTHREVCREGEVLLINTGCLLLDLRRPWWDDFAFEFRTRIIRHEGRRVAQFAPEDWLLSHHVRASGGTVAATFAVPVVHHGHGEWAT